MALTASLFMFFGITSSLLQGWVLSVLWNWYIVPVGAPTLTVPTAIGAVLILALPRGFRTVPDVGLKKALEHLYLRPAVFLAVGWVFHFFR